MHVAGVDGEGRRSKRARARAMKAAHHASQTARGFVPSGTGVDAWLPEADAAHAEADRIPPSGEAGGPRGRRRAAASPSRSSIPRTGCRSCRARSSWRRTSTRRPIATRSACSRASRTRARGASGSTCAGKTRAICSPLLKGRRVIVEPQMMELRFGDEPLRPRFDLELSPDGDADRRAHVVPAPGRPAEVHDRRGRLVRGQPGLVRRRAGGLGARPIDRRVSPAAMRRLLRLPVITEPVERLPELVDARACRRSRSRSAPSCPELSQVADVVDLVPTFRVARRRHARRGAGQPARGLRGRRDRRPRRRDDACPSSSSRRARRRGRRATRRAPRPRRRGQARQVHPVRHRGAARRPPRSCATWAWSPTKTATSSSPAATTRSASGPRASATLPDEWDIFVPDDLVDVHVRDEALSAQRARRERRRLAVACASTSRARASPSPQDELARCLADGRKYVRLADGSFARIDPQKVREVLQRQAEILATGGGNGGQLPLSQAGRIEELLAQVGALERHGRREGALQEAPGHRRDQGHQEAAQPQGAAPPVPGAGLSLALVPPRDRLAAASWPTTWASARRCRPSRSSSR